MAHRHRQACEDALQPASYRRQMGDTARVEVVRVLAMSGGIGSQRSLDGLRPGRVPGIACPSRVGRHRCDGLIGVGGWIGAEFFRDQEH